MAQSNWFSWNGNGNDTTSDPSTFNYDVQAQKLKRARDAANALQQLSMQGNQGQIISNGAGTFFAGGNNVATTAAKLLAAYMSTQDQSSADQQQQDLANNSQAAFQKQYSNLFTPTRDPAQDGIEAKAQNDRELARFQSALDNTPAQQSVNGQPDSSPPELPPIRQDGQTAPVALPPVQATAAPPAPVKSVSSTVKQSAAKALTSRAFDAGTGADSWDAPAQANPSDEGTAASLFNSGLDAVNGAVGNAVKKGLKWFTGTDDGAPQAAVPPAPAQGQAAPQALPPMPQLSAPVPPMPGAPQATPQPSPQAAPQAPAALPPMPQGSPQAAPAQQAPSSMPAPQGDPTPYNLPLTQQDIAGRLIQLGRTGPEGQQIANAQLNQMFASKNGRFETKVMADPVNGGFVQVTTDTATGQTVNVQAIGANGGKMVTGQTTDAQGNRLNLHRDGTTSPLLDANGKPVQDPATMKTNSEAVTSIVGKRGEAQAKLADLTKMETDLQLASGLVGQANVGPLAGTVGGVYNKFLGNSTANDTLDRVLNDSRLQQILQDKGGNGSVGAGLMKAYQGHSMSRDLSPSALSQGLGQALSTVQAQRAALQAEIGAHNYSLGQLGYQDPAASAAPAAPAGNGRPGGVYSF